jgi:hypothetical protein
MVEDRFAPKYSHVMHFGFPIRFHISDVRSIKVNIDSADSTVDIDIDTD